MEHPGQVIVASVEADCGSANDPTSHGPAGHCPVGHGPADQDHAYHDPADHVHC